MKYGVRIETASMPAFSAMRVNSIVSRVVTPTVPAYTGTRPRVSSTTVSHTRRFSSGESAQNSPWLPTANTPCTLPSIRWFVRRRSAFSLISSSAVSGVTIAGMIPEGGLFSMNHSLVDSWQLASAVSN